jgi:signal transduction histidine kinase
MHTPNKPEQIQTFFEIAMAIGTSLDLNRMVKTSLLSYLQKLNCSFGAVLQLHCTENNVYYYKNIFSIPYKSKFSDTFENVIKLIPNKTSIDELERFYTTLPLKKDVSDDVHFYVMHLSDFGLICLKKNGDGLTNDVLFTLKILNNKLAQACTACVRNQDLITSKERAEESDRLKTAFIENISHEIRTPLNAIMGYSSLIADKQITEKMLVPACKSIVNSSDKLLAMIESLLNVSMLESGNVKPKYNLFNINQLLLAQENVFNRHAGIEQKTDLNFSINNPAGDIFIVSDELSLMQIFENLLSNAVRFSDAGRIEIGYLNDKGPLNKQENSVTFYVKDPGMGISSDQHLSIFKPFVRIENSREKIYQGTGIGLTITKRLVNLLEGEIWLESEPTIGTTFFFTIPTIKTIDKLVMDL